MKNKHRRAKNSRDTSLCYSIAECTRQVLLTFLKVGKNTLENKNFDHCLFFFLSSSSLTCNSKLYSACMQILYIPNDCSAAGGCYFLVRDGVRAMTCQLCPLCWYIENFGPRVSTFIEVFECCT